ncbi:unnamed protein product, partial [Pleuronectes platessa]
MPRLRCAPTEARNTSVQRRLAVMGVGALLHGPAVVLSIQAAAIQFTKEPKSQDALHGRSAMLRCEVSDPADISYGWLHNGQRLENSERLFQEGSNLKFTAVDRQLDAGNFECVAENAATGETLHSTNASFNINGFSPPPALCPSRSLGIRGEGRVQQRRGGSGITIVTACLLVLEATPGLTLNNHRSSIMSESPQFAAGPFDLCQPQLIKSDTSSQKACWA